MLQGGRRVRLWLSVKMGQAGTLDREEEEEAKVGKCMDGPSQSSVHESKLVSETGGGDAVINIFGRNFY